MADLEGKTLGRYELRQIIGRGGMADVYAAYDPHFERDVAVKVFKRQDEEMLRRFIREARLMASLRNPHLMPVYDTGESVVDGILQYYIVMPIMDGGTLRARIRRAPLSLDQTCHYLRDIASALDYVHSQGIIHRDIKSSNVLLNSDGRCYLSDFGVARTTTDVTQVTSTGNVLGTVDYVAPELFEPYHKADALTDLYSLGVLLFEMVTGRVPFSGDTQIAVVAMHVGKRPPSPRTFVPDIPPQAEYVILRALEKNPAQRYQSATELATAFCSAASTSRTRDLGASTSSPTWGNENTVVQPSQGKPLILPPAPVLPQGVGRAPSTTSATGPYSSSISSQRTYAPQTPNQNKPTPPAHKQGRIVLIMALLVLLIVIVPMVYIATRSPAVNPSPTPTTTTNISTPTPDLNATAQVVGATATSRAAKSATATAQAAATATVQASKNATATAVVAPTATVQAQVTATAGVIQTVTAGTANYTDPLTDPNNPDTQKAKWDPDTAHCVFEASGYHVFQAVSSVRDTLKGCMENGFTYSNMAASVDVTIASGHSGGIFFRANNQGIGGVYAGYLFEIDSQGHYRVSRSSNFSLPVTVALQDWTASPALKPGNNIKNTLQVWANGEQLDLYANNVFLKEVQDPTFTTGNIAFLATTTTGGTDADVFYTNLQLFPK